jgi:transmembrane sensor
MEKEEIRGLLKKYSEGKCTEAEKALLEAWYLQYNEDEGIDLTPREIKAIGDRVFRELPGNHHAFWKAGLRLAAAAVFIGIVVTIAVKLWLPQEKPVSYANDIAPGSNKAVLTLSDGKRISLNDAAAGQLAARSGLRIVKTGSGQVIYQVTGENAGAGSNNITTPNGGQWQVLLPDGTKVWINSESSFTYPVSFAGLNRVVELSGEAYFEVAKDKSHPFIVKTGRQELEVLGTHFNLAAYRDEASVRTTLAEGRVRVSGLTGQTKILAPGQQSVLTNSDFIVKEADLEEALAWKEGYFRFNDEKIESIMHQLSRWYNIEVIYDGDMSPGGLNGKISRYKNISQVLKALEATKTVHFKVEGRRVTVMR